MIDEPRLNEYLTWKEPVKIIQRPEKNYALEIIQPAKYQELVRPYLPLANELKTRSP